MLRRLTILTLAVGLTVACADDDDTTPTPDAGTADTTTDGTDATDGTDDGTDGTDDGTDGTDDGTDGTDDGTDGTDDGTDGTDDGTDGTDDGTDGTDSTDGEPMGADNPPTPGAQIDRVGRPAISTALIAPFETDDTAKGMAKDAYNAASDPSTWTDFIPQIEGSLAIYDALDTVCGNQLLADGSDGTMEDRYLFLATVLADDRLYVNSLSNACVAYLGVEAQVVGAVEDGGCGGRTLEYDVIDASYTVLATGALDGSLGDGVPSGDAAGLPNFPYLPPPTGGN